jgi:hypothetical protein
MRNSPTTYLEKWVRADTPGYKRLTKDFEYANESLTHAARDKNVDGATIAYLQLTISCVNCHKIARDVGKSSWRLPPSDPRAIKSRYEPHSAAKVVRSTKRRKPSRRRFAISRSAWRASW